MHAKSISDEASISNFASIFTTNNSLSDTCVERLWHNLESVEEENTRDKNESHHVNK